VSILVLQEVYCSNPHHPMFGVNVLAHEHTVREPSFNQVSHQTQALGIVGHVNICPALWRELEWVEGCDYKNCMGYSKEQGY